MKFQTIAKAAALAALGAAFAAPAQAETINATLTVTGTLTPGACTVSFTGGGAVDYGNIPSANLSATSYNKLADMTKDLSVVCGSETHAYVSVGDNRAANVIKDAAMKTVLGDATLADTQVFGLGTSGTTDIGAYTVKMGTATVANAAGTSAKQPAVLSSADKSAWTASTSPVALDTASQYYSAGPTGTDAVPVKGKTFTFPLTVTAALNNTTNLPVSNNVALDGSATFAVSYN